MAGPVPTSAGPTSPSPAGRGRATYRQAGVDIAAGEEAVARIRRAVASTARPEVLGGIGDFAGCFAFDPARYRRPVLVSSTDGVGTKLAVAVAVGRFDTVGIDLVAMCVDDVACLGAEPLFLLDYISTGSLDPGMIEQLVGSVADGCRRAGCALLGGEMAEHGSGVPAGHVELAAFVVGVAEHDEMLGSERVQAGDVLVGLASPGLRSNGYSLARHVLIERAGRSLDGPAWPGAGRSLADELLEPSVVYSPAMAAARRGLPVGAVHAAAHVTGGGIPGNLSRVLPGHLDAVVDRARWEEPRIFDEVRRLGEVAEEEMEAVFNLGIGMVLVVDAAAAEQTRRLADAEGVEAVVVGQVTDGTGRVQVVRR